MEKEIVAFALLLIMSQLACVLSGTFLSIDCGSSDPYSDVSRSIKWVGDEAYVRNGLPQYVQFSSSLPPVVNTLRSFPFLNKNCYSIPIVEAEKLLVRASFYYGNYDALDSPPIFDLYYDNNFWTTVNLTTFASTYLHYELIYTSKSTSINICLVRTLAGNNIPFITSIELRSLDDTMYNAVAPHYSLFLMTRTALGATTLTRYPDDEYDRYWYPGFGFGLSSRTSEATSIDISTTQDKPPEAVMKNATTGDNGTSQFIQLLTRLSTSEIPVYLNLYFSEVSLSVASTQTRSFQLFIDETPFSKPIVPPFGSVVELQVSNITASSQTSFTLRPTADATVPPLINAFEVYSVDSYSTIGTDSRDVEGLGILQEAFKVLLAWSGDPCFPSSSAWEWVQCTKDNTPRVISLNLAGFGLVGTLPDFSSMDALVTIDFHNNSISGPIPTYLAQLPKLKKLDLSENRFNGSVPASLSGNKNLTLLVTENCLAGMSCPPPPPPPPRGLTILDDNNPPPPPPPPTSIIFDMPVFTGSGTNKNAHLPFVFGGIVHGLLLLNLIINF